MREAATILDSSCGEAPSANRDRMRRSRETDGSPASILATRDWLDRSVFARATCVMFWRRRRLCRPRARRSLSSIYATSSSDNPRKSFTLPTLHPLDSSRSRLVLRILKLLQPLSADVNYRLWGRLSLLGENFQDDNRVCRHVVDDSPCHARIINPQLVATRAYRHHRTGVGQ